ncbi:hypothetical protein J3R30DRAFT_3486771 [Lentinula aciculospora]|uniref:DUF7918 domain-containing protein n=1 Tax=Lentinula aciculospora TaxID=153920 RepID=A0A9W9A9E7_9AGAR|nr:hypothetical protein J3R30DRAFT_3486771 [Lentinula aciculospora]
MLFLGNFGAWISIDGVKHLEEYGVDINHEEKTVTCYIASEEGESFQVHWYDKSFESPTKGRVYIDGRAMGGKIISETTINRSVVKKGFRTDVNRRMPFVFSKLKLTDNEDLVGTSRESLGEIDLVIIRVRLRSKRAYNKSHSAPETLEFNEKEVKGVAHNTTFGEPIMDSAIVLEYETEPYGVPIARFCFRYMPIDVLRARDIAPYPVRKKQLLVKEEDRKPYLPVDFSMGDSVQSASLVSTLVGSPASGSLSTMLTSRGESTMTHIDSPAPLTKPVKRVNPSVSAASLPISRAVKRERTDNSSALASSSRYFIPEPFNTTSLEKQDRVVPGSPEVIDLTHL